MRLKDIKIFVVGNQPPAFGGQYFLFVKVTTDNNITGYGEMYAASVSPNVQQKIAEDLFGRYCVGESPFNVELLFRKFHSSGFSQRPDPTIMGALSAIEIACWDIIGKELNQPIYNLIGGLINPKLRSYTYLYPNEKQNHETFYNDPDMSAKCAAEYVKQGFTAVKFDPAGAYTIHDPHEPSLEDITRSKKFCKAIRDAVGDKADILFGTHGQFTPAGAIRMANNIAQYDPLWFEEPTPPEMPEQMAIVAKNSPVPIATGERLTTKYEFARVLGCGAAAILQPALGRVGGIMEAKKIASIAEVHYAKIAPHLYCGPIEALANIQFAAASPNFLVLESIKQFGGFYKELLDKPIQWENGYVIPSTNPGLGHNLNEEIAEKNPYKGNKLHLEMKDKHNEFNQSDKFAGG